MEKIRSDVFYNIEQKEEKNKGCKCDKSALEIYEEEYSGRGSSIGGHRMSWCFETL